MEIHKPPKRIQRILNKTGKHPVASEVSTAFAPNGARAKMASLKH